MDPGKLADMIQRLEGLVVKENCGMDMHTDLEDGDEWVGYYARIFPYPAHQRGEYCIDSAEIEDPKKSTYYKHPEDALEIAIDAFEKALNEKRVIPWADYQDRVQLHKKALLKQGGFKPDQVALRELDGTESYWKVTTGSWSRTIKVLADLTIETYKGYSDDDQTK